MQCSAYFKQRNQSRTVYRAWFFCCRLLLCCGRSIWNHTHFRFPAEISGHHQYFRRRTCPLYGNPSADKKGGGRSPKRKNGRNYENVSFLVCCRNHESGGDPHIPVCFFLFWNFCRCGTVTRHYACIWRLYRYLYLVGNAHCCH